MENQNVAKQSLGKKLVVAFLVAIATGFAGLLFHYHREIYAWIVPPKPSIADGIAPTEALEAIAADLERLDAEERQYCRYFVLAHLYDPEIRDGDRDRARAALTQAVAWAMPPGQVCALDPVGRHNAILRVNLSHLGWDAKTQWRAILEQYPYGLDRSTGGENRGASAEKRIRKAIPELPYVRGDWFAAKLCVAPLAAKLAPKIGKEVPSELGAFARDYPEQVLDLKAVGRELGQNSTDGILGKIHEEKRLQEKQGLASLSSGGMITRSAWESRRFGISPFQDLAQCLKIGIPESQ